MDRWLVSLSSLIGFFPKEMAFPVQSGCTHLSQLQLTSLSLNLFPTFGGHTVFHGFRRLCHYTKHVSEYQIQNWDPGCVGGRRLGG